MEDAQGRWLVMEGPSTNGRAPYRARFESIGCHLPEARLTTDDLMASTRHRTRIDLERLTGIHERHVASDGEDSYSLAVAAARDCLAHSDHGAEDLDVVINCSISRYQGGLCQRFEPPLSLAVKHAIGATRAWNFDLSNACAGTLSGVFVLNDLIRRGAIRRGLVVSGEAISNLGTNAARRIRWIGSELLASLTLGDAGVAAIVERAPKGRHGIKVAGFTTIAEHSRLCLAYPARSSPGASMFTKARKIHEVALEDLPPLLAEALAESGIGLDEVDWVIPHQTSARAIRTGAKELSAVLGGEPKHTVVNVEEFGNTASTTHFVALYRYLEEGRFRPGEQVALIALASGLEIGVLVFEVDELVERYGNRG